MGKYQLVGLYYDEKTRKFTNEKQLISKKDSLTGLMNIDKYTSNRNGIDLWDELAKYNDISNINTLAIKYVKEKDSIPIYMPVFIDDDIIFSVVQDYKSRRFDYDRREHDYFINHDNPKFFKVYNNFKNILYDFKYSKGDKKKSYQKYITRLVKNNYNLERYINLSQDDIYYYHDGQHYIIDVIKEELSRYKTFRSVLVADGAYSKTWLSSYDFYKEYVSKNNIDDFEREKSEEDSLKNLKDDLDDDTIVRTYIRRPDGTFVSVYIEHEKRPESYIGARTKEKKKKR